MSNIQIEINDLLKVARDSRDDSIALWQIALRLEQLGAWDEQKKVVHMAQDAERRYAELLNK